MSDDRTADEYAAHFREEIDSAYLYRVVAGTLESPELAEVFERLAETESEHASFWAERLEGMGRRVPAESPSARARVLAWIARHVGPGFVLGTLTTGEVSGSTAYADEAGAEGTPLVAEEASHARVLRELDTTQGVEGGTLARLEGRHRSTSGNALRAAVLGANDGLVSNLSLVMGVAGAALAGSAILVTGLAGLLAGAASMAMGEWLSVQSSRELYENQIAVEAAELEATPDEEEIELSLIYQAKGLPEDQADALAARIVSNRESALDTLAREELGIDPEALGGSAYEAAATSFVLFAVGAVIPVIPFTFASGLTAVAVSVAASAVALFVIGAAITLFTGRGVLYSGGRQVAIGLAAAAVTYVAGTLVGGAIA